MTGNRTNICLKATYLLAHGGPQILETCREVATCLQVPIPVTAVTGVSPQRNIAPLSVKRLNGALERAAASCVPKTVWPTGILAPGEASRRRGCRAQAPIGRGALSAERRRKSNRRGETSYSEAPVYVRRSVSVFLSTRGDPLLQIEYESSWLTHRISNHQTQSPGPGYTSCGYPINLLTMRPGAATRYRMEH